MCQSCYPAGQRVDWHPVRITQAFIFEAAHRLPKVPAAHKCSRLHGHSYRVELRLEGPVHPETGFVVDFFDIERAFAPLLERLDHNTLNEVEGLDNPRAIGRSTHFPNPGR